MILTFPHMGPMEYSISKFFKTLGIAHITPPANRHGALQIGMELSPEEMCMPFKFMLGNLKQAFDMGADTAIMAATCGPCRLGEYCQLMMKVLAECGCSYDWIILDSPAAIGMQEFKARICKMTEGSDNKKSFMARAALDGVRLIYSFEKLREKIEMTAGYLSRPYEAVRLLRYTEDMIEKAEGFKESFDIVRDSYSRLRKLEKDPMADPIRVLITGEIYTSIEEEANGRLEERLMLLGCSVKRHLSISWWMRHTVSESIFKEKSGIFFGKCEGIPCNIGGYGRQTVSKIMRDKTFDGIIKIMPSGCMPEIVAKAFCEKLQETGEYRVLHLVYDEMSGDAGYQTRIEAFVDMLERRKHVLAGNRHRFNKYGSGSCR